MVDVHAINKIEIEISTIHLLSDFCESFCESFCELAFTMLIIDLTAVELMLNFNNYVHRDDSGALRLGEHKNSLPNSGLYVKCPFGHVCCRTCIGRYIVAHMGSCSTYDLMVTKEVGDVYEIDLIMFVSHSINREPLIITPKIRTLELYLMRDYDRDIHNAMKNSIHCPDIRRICNQVRFGYYNPPFEIEFQEKARDRYTKTMNKYKASRLLSLSFSCVHQRASIRQPDELSTYS